MGDVGVITETVASTSLSYFLMILSLASQCLDYSKVWNSRHSFAHLTERRGLQFKWRLSGASGNSAVNAAICVF